MPESGRPPWDDLEVTGPFNRAAQHETPSPEAGPEKHEQSDSSGRKPPVPSLEMLPPGMARIPVQRPQQVSPPLRADDRKELKKQMLLRREFNRVRGKEYEPEVEVER